MHQMTLQKKNTKQLDPCAINVIKKAHNNMKENFFFPFLKCMFLLL